MHSVLVLLVLACFAVSFFAGRGAMRAHKARFFAAFNEPEYATPEAAWAAGMQSGRMTGKYVALFATAVIFGFVGVVGWTCL